MRCPVRSDVSQQLQQRADPLTSGFLSCRHKQNPKGEQAPDAALTTDQGLSGLSSPIHTNDELYLCRAEDGAIVPLSSFLHALFSTLTTQLYPCAGAAHRHVCAGGRGFDTRTTSCAVDGRPLPAAHRPGLSSPVPPGTFVWAVLATSRQRGPLTFCTPAQSLFIVDTQTRQFMNMPHQADVDYRAACFCHKKAVDIGHVCSVCLSGSSSRTLPHAPSNLLLVFSPAVELVDWPVG